MVYEIGSFILYHVYVSNLVNYCSLVMNKGSLFSLETYKLGEDNVLIIILNLSLLSLNYCSFLQLYLESYLLSG